jgi:hypothetical protein
VVVVGKMVVVVMWRGGVSRVVGDGVVVRGILGRGLVVMVFS